MKTSSRPTCTIDRSLNRHIAALPAPTSARRARAFALLSAVGALLCAACNTELDPNVDSEDGSPVLPAPEPLTPEAVAAIHQAVAEQLGQRSATGYSVAVWRDGEVVYSEGFGTKDEQGSPVTPATVFRIGSDTKKIAAIALLQHVQAQGLDLSSSVASVLPELSLASDPSFFESVSLRDLLQQSSGLYDYAPWVDAPSDSALAQIAVGRFAQNEYALMPPGIAWDYSNPNYSLVGLLTEKLDGRAWSDIVASDIFAPLGLQHTYARRDDALRAERDIASGHGNYPVDSVGVDTFSPFDVTEEQTGWLRPEQLNDNAFVRPAGLAWSTASDQARLLGFLIDGNESVLSDELRTAMMTPHKPVYNGDTSMVYGYGLMVEPGFPAPDGQYYPTQFVWHNGNSPLMASISLTLPEQRVAVSILANSDGEDLMSVAKGVLAAATAERLPQPTPAPQTPAPADLSSYAGSFEDVNLGPMTLAWSGDELRIEVPLLDSLEVPYEHVLEPVARDHFEWTVAGETKDISFYDGNGRAHEYGVARDFVLRRSTPATTR